MKIPAFVFIAAAAVCFHPIENALGQAPVKTSGPAEIWVSPGGDDAGDGTEGRPLLTVGEALRRERSLRRTRDARAAAGVRIVLRGGTYPLVTPLSVTPYDGGKAESPTVIEGASGERAVISGGVVLGGWQKAGRVEGLPAAAEGRVWVSDGPVFCGNPLRFRQLWVNGKKAVRARTPNGDTCARLVSWDRKEKEAGIPAEVAAGVHDPAGVEMILQQQWEIAVLRLKSVRVEGEEGLVRFQEPESALEFEHPWPQPILPPKGGGAFFLANAVEFLDSPGEWWQDSHSGRVYYWPREGEEMGTAEVVAPAVEKLMTVAGTVDQPVTNVTFRNLSFAYSTWMRPSEQGDVPIQAGMPMTESYKIKPAGTSYHPGLDNQNWIVRVPAAVTVSGAEHIRFERCRFEHTAASGLDFVSGTHDDVIEGCLFRDIGGNGIQMGCFQEGPIENHVPYDPSDERIVCQRERIANNLVTDAANEDWGSVGIAAGYVRNVTIEHNEVNNVSYTGISLGWGWTKLPNAMRDNVVHANRLDHVATRMCDTAGIYTLSNQPGTVVSENCVDHIVMSPYVDRPEHWFYLYTDEGSSHITVKENWCPAEKFLKNANGPGNVWENNGPNVSERIKIAAGLEPAFRDLLRDSTLTNLAE
ncbi:MAG: right-handed parallel beta-helix repeat-containing protein [Phycisphaerae bacterium]